MLSLREKIDVWHGLPLATPEQQVWADTYYDTELMPLALKRFADKYRQQKLPEYYGMILLLGNAWEDLAFNVGLLSPQNIHVICTKENLPAYRRLRQNLRLEEDRSICTTLNPGDTASLYRVIKKQHDIWDSVGRSAIDVTGADIEMALAGAMVSSALDMDVYRLVTQKATPLARHEPGTEHLLHIPSVQSILNL